MKSPKEEEIALWKEEHGAIFSVPTKDVEYVFKELTLKQIDKMLKIESQTSAEDYIIESALLFPSDKSYIDKAPAGIISALAEEIVEISGLGDPDRSKEVMNNAREDAQQFKNLMKAFVMATIPSYTEDQIDDMTFSILATKVALAEQIIKVNQAMIGVEHDVSLDVIDPEEVEEEQKRQEALHKAKSKPGAAGFNDPIAQKLNQALG